MEFMERGRQKLEEDIEVKGMALEVDREALQLELVRIDICNM
jgi:hypothetical protein